MPGGAARRLVGGPGVTVHIEKDGDVTVVTLDRPDVRNAVDSDHALALYEAFLAFDGDDSAKVAVFHGAHGHFCAGWDLQFGAQLLRMDINLTADELALCLAAPRVGWWGDQK